MEKSCGFGRIFSAFMEIGSRWTLWGILLMFPSWVTAGQLSLGVQGLAWNSTFSQPFHGQELLTPMALQIEPVKDVSLFAQTEFAGGAYTDSLSGTANTRILTGLSDSVLGGELDFKIFSLPSLLNVGFNLPTGDPTWETKQLAANIPTEFIDSRYRGRGFGFSALYGVSLRVDPGALGVAAGYLYSGAFAPGSALGPGTPLKLGDSFLLSASYLQVEGDGQSDLIRISSYFFSPTLENGSAVFQLGPNLNASFSRTDSRAFSFEAGGQFYLPAQRPTTAGGPLVTESQISFGPRFYFTGGYNFGGFNLTGRIKYVTPNGYGASDTLYDGGGFLFGVQPSYLLKLDEKSGLRFKVSYDNVVAQGLGVLSDGSHVDVIYNLWTLGTNYELKL